MPHAAQPQLRASRSLAVARDGYLSDSSSANETVHPSRAHLKGHTSDHDLTPTKQSFFDLHESLSSLSEPRLRALLLSLAANHPEIEPMIVQELRTQPKILSNARTPEAKLKKERIRRGSSASRKGEKCLTCGLRPKVADKDKEGSCCGAGASAGANAGVRACRYHPGEPVDEVYEFLSRTPEGRTFTVLRTITAWSCCDQDARAPGCANAPSHTYRSS